MYTHKKKRKKEKNKTRAIQATDFFEGSLKDPEALLMFRLQTNEIIESTETGALNDFGPCMSNNKYVKPRDAVGKKILGRSKIIRKRLEPSLSKNAFER